MKLILKISLFLSLFLLFWCGKQTQDNNVDKNKDNQTQELETWAQTDTPTKNIKAVELKPDERFKNDIIKK